ncbi:MAG TPA: ABC transporter substrate-binding protein [Candidatus Deferrimicrobiaceae bacterium]|nr:ABC transporter substrate-binding protein [Candidatus Deferrimicrobiaceae bacterium]
MTPMHRRAFLALLAAGVTPPPPAAAQPAGRVHRLGILAPTAPPSSSEQNTAVILIPKALREMGYAPGRDLVVDVRYAEGRLDRLPALARELVRLRMDVIVAISASAALAVKAATTTIPIVLYGNLDPVAAGLVKSLAKPESNITGVLIAPAGTLAAKKLEILKEAVPGATRIAFLAPPDPGIKLQVQETQQAAATLGIKLAIFVGAHTFFVRDRKRIIALAATHRLPAMYEWPTHVEDGGLMSYGSSLAGTTRRVAVYVDRLFKGARPGDLPVEQPAEFQLVINLKTARALGLTLPPSLVARADRIIE